jgi:hypothetical protein
MTNPRHAFETENGRYYNVPGIDKPLVSVTNAISVGLAKYGLPLWYANMATEAAWELVPMMGNALRKPLCGRKDDWTDNPDERPCGECVECITRRIKGAAEKKRDSAAFLGTRVHTLAEAHVLGRTLPEEEGDHEAGWYVRQYLKFLADFGVDLQRDVVAAESTVVHADYGYAGTGDIWLKLPGIRGILWEKGKPIVVRCQEGEEPGTILIDIKTSRTRAATQSYPENVMQLAALRHAKHMLLPDDSLVPNLRVHGTATLQLRERAYALIPLPSDNPQFMLFRNVLYLAEWLHNDWPGAYEYRPLLANGKFKPKRGKKEEA